MTTNNENDIVGSGVTTNVIIGNNNATITIGSGDSNVAIGNGNNTITAGDHDTIAVGNGVNTITIGSYDTLTVGSGNHSITAGHNDTISVGNGVNTIVALATVTVFAGNGQDSITAGPMSTITAGNGTDTVHVGHDSAVTLGSGPDNVHAGTTDAITVNPKSSLDNIEYDGLTPAFTVPASLSVSEEQSVALPITILPPTLGNEVINGFKTANGIIGFDTHDFANAAAVLGNASQVGANTVITQPGGGGTVTLTNVSLSSLSASNFVFFTGPADVINITGVPSDATLSAGTKNLDGSWTLTPAQLSGLQLNAGEPIGYPSPDILTVTITNPAGEGASSSQTIPLVVNAIPPTVGVSVLPYQSGDPITETRLQVVSATDDGDGGNDYINRIQLSNVPGGVTLSSPGNTVTADGGGVYTISTSGQPASFNPEVDVTTPGAQTTNFNLGVTSFSDEPNSPQLSSPTAMQNIDVEYTPETATPTFTSTNQNIWQSGPGFTLDDNRFLGVDFPNGYPGSPPYSNSASIISGISAGATFGVRAGFESNLHLDAGEFNGSLPYNVNMPTTFNKTNDTLEVDPSDSKGTGSFNTTSPEGSYHLDFVVNFVLNAFAGPINIGPFTLNTDINLLSLNSSTLSHTFDLPDGIGDVKVAWPTVDTSGSGSGSTITASGTSNPIFQVNIDPIAVLMDIITGGDPLKGGNSLSIGVASVGYKYTILAGTVEPGIDLAQSFTLTDNGPSATLEDNGTPEPFNFGSPTIIQNAPSTNNFSLQLDPNTDLSNTTGLAGQLVLGLTVLKLSGTATAVGFSTSTSFTVAHPTTTIHFGSIPLYQNTFPVAFNSQTVNYTVA